MTVKSNPTIYSYSDKFVHNFGTVKPNEKFILTGRGSESTTTSNNLRYYWRLVRGNKSPSIVSVEEDGCTIKFRAPNEECGEIEFELKVVDVETEEYDIKNITVKVTNEDKESPKIHTST